MAMVDLTPRERVLLEVIAMQTINAKELRRAQALIWLDDGDSVDEVAERLSASRRTIYYWVERFIARDDMALVGRLADAPRCGRPATAQGIIDPLIDQIIEADPREVGYRSTVWTAPLLRQYLSEHHEIDICQRSVSYALDRLGIGWKRPRHDLSRCHPYWRQAKGGSSGGFPAESAR